jgi:sucrose-6-phosphate hydrolase SacC (GH32 family)
MIKFITAFILFFSLLTVNAQETSPPTASRAQCASYVIQGSEIDLKLHNLNLKKLLQVKEGEVALIQKNMILSEGTVAASYGDFETVNELKQLGLEIDRKYEKAQKLHIGITAREEILLLDKATAGEKFMTQGCTVRKIENKEVEEACATLDELKDAVNCKIIRYNDNKEASKSPTKSISTHSISTKIIPVTG